MTDTDKQLPTPKPPSHVAYHVSNGKDGDSQWQRIGVAWTHRDGNGFNIQLDELPPEKRITLRIPMTKTA